MDRILIKEYKMATARDKNHYLTAWNNVVSNLNGLSFPLIESSNDHDDYYAELKAIRVRLNELIAIAANNEFKEG
jgi:hypothetical protein